MVITILEAQVAAEKTAVLESTYQQSIQHLDAGIVQTFLTQNIREPGLWQILTVWESREALETMRQSGETPRGVLIFRAANAEPRLSIHRVAAKAQAR